MAIAPILAADAPAADAPAAGVSTVEVHAAALCHDEGGPVARLRDLERAVAEFWNP